jgi:Tol biopolymer transport system component
VDSVSGEELLYADDLEKRPSSWSADGKFLLYAAILRNSKTRWDLWALPLTPERPGAALKPFLVLQTAFNEFDGQLSPDGRWMAYGSDESQRTEVYVTPFPLSPSGPGGKRQISTGGVAFGFPPLRWRQDGREIFYVAPDWQLMAAEVASKGTTLEVGVVRPLFSRESAAPSGFDVSADGQRFLMLASPEQKSVEPFTLIQNWAPGLNK